MCASKLQKEGAPRGSFKVQNQCVMLIDTEREKEIEIGVTYPYPPLGPGECLIPEAKKEFLEVEIGDRVIVEIE
jgi:hypothetical protein